MPQDGSQTELASWLASFDRIALVANSSEASPQQLTALPDGTLFVFFNRVFKILERPFTRPCVLMVRCADPEPNLVYRREQDTVLSLLDGGSFNGVIQLRAASHERFAGSDAFGAAPVARLDLVEEFQRTYPARSVPTSGYALAVWLLSYVPDTTVELCGFSARRMDRYKLFDAHDWTFEQIVLRTLHANGRLRHYQAASDDWPLAQALGQVSPNLPIDPAIVAATLAERLRGTNVLVDRIWSQLKPVRAFDGWLRKMKPKTRRERIVRRREDGRD